jgi:hypothetical protein
VLAPVQPRAQTRTHLRPKKMDAAETTSTSCTCGLMILAEWCLLGAAPLLVDMSLAEYRRVRGCRGCRVAYMAF